jgi:hypothetical protein
MNINYKSPELIKYTENLSTLKNKYKEDKKLLTKILKALQDTAAYNIYNMRKHSYTTNDN